MPLLTPRPGWCGLSCPDNSTLRGFTVGEGAGEGSVSINHVWVAIQYAWYTPWEGQAPCVLDTWILRTLLYWGGGIRGGRNRGWWAGEQVFLLSVVRGREILSFPGYYNADFQALGMEFQTNSLFRWEQCP